MTDALDFQGLDNWFFELWIFGFLKEKDKKEVD